MSPNSGYSENELLQMQQDAIRRVQEMQQRAQRTLENGWNTGQEQPAAPVETVVPEIMEPAALPPPGPNQNQGHTPPGGQNARQGQQNGNPFAGTPLAGLGSSLGGLGNLGNLANLGSLFQGQTSSPIGGLMQWAGGERGILVALLVLLMGEGADPTLLLALFYLVMFDDDSSAPPAPPPGDST